MKQFACWLKRSAGGRLNYLCHKTWQLQIFQELFGLEESGLQ
jgi:hypothetical protein